MERLGRLLRVVGMVLLALSAATGVLLAAGGWVASSGPGSRLVARQLTRALDGLVAGRLTVGSLTVSAGGDAYLSDLEVVDPAGHPVIRVARARARVRLAGWGLRTVRVELELERPEVWLEPNAVGELTIAAAFRTAGPASPAARDPGIGDPWGGWVIQLTRLRLHDGTVTWRGDGERTWLVARGLGLDGTARLGTPGISAGLRLTGTVETPLEGPLRVEVAARIEGSRLTVPRLVLGAAGSRVEAFGEFDWERETFRAAATRVALAERDLTALAGRRVAGGDLEGRLYAESDGDRLTAAVDLGTPTGGSGGGRAALAFRLARGRGSPRFFGFDAALDQVDPARVLSRAPRGRVTVAGRGALAWPFPPPGPVSRGHVTVDRLDVALPGVSLKGAGRWRDAGDMGGALQLVASDLAAAGPAVEALLGITLPVLSGQAAASLAWAGTAAAPEATLTLLAPRGQVARTLLTDGRAELRLAGSRVELEGATGLDLFEGAAVSARAAATLWPGWQGATLTRLEVGVAGQDWALAAPVQATFDGPRLDRADLASGPQRLSLAGGLHADGTAELTLEASGLDLSRLPRGLLPGSLGLAGRGSGTLRLAGPAARRSLDARVEVSDGALASLTGLGLQARLAWRRQSGRLELDGALRRAGGGTVEVAAGLPWPLDGAAAGAAVTGRVAAADWPLQPLWRALEVELASDGRFAGELTLAGSAGEPRIAAHLALTEVRWADQSPLALTATVEGAGPTLRSGAELKLEDEVLARAAVELAYDRGALLAHPGRTLGRLARTAWSARLELPGTELARVAGKAGVPPGLTGRLAGEAALVGTPAAPRGTGALTLTGMALAGYPPLGGRVSLTLGEARTGLEARLESDGAPALRLLAELAAPVEALGRAEVQRRAPLQVSAVIPELTLHSPSGRPWSLAGKVALNAELAGTLAAPLGSVALDATGLTLGGLPFGDLKGTARSEGHATRLDVTLVPVGGGTLRVDGTVDLVPGLGTTALALEEAPLALAVRGRDLSVGFLPPLLPGKVRNASGRLETELTVTGSARAPRLNGTAALSGGKVTLAGLGTFTDIRFEASVDQRAIRVVGLSVRREEGRLEGTLSVEGLDEAEAKVGGSLTASAFTLSRGGMEVATLDARATLGGRYRERRAEVEVNVGDGASIRLPRKSPRTLQPLDDRPDIVVGVEPPPPAGNNPDGTPVTAPGSPGRSEAALTASIRVRCGELLVKSDKPRVLVELRTDSTWEVTTSPLQAAGTIDAVRGTFEPISGRLFKVVRGHVAFTGGPLEEAQLDLAADYEAPSTKVHANISGTIRAPLLRLTSEPALDEASLAMLIVTGRADMSMGGTQGGSLKAQDVGMAAAMAVANSAFEEKLGEKMPLDSLTLDSTSVSAGKQLTDRIRVNYVRRFDAKVEKGENVDEVRVQYHMTPRWTLETRYGNAGAGGASLIWQKDY